MSARSDVVHPEVLSSYSTDIGRGIARLDVKSMNVLDVRENDIIEVKAKRSSVAKCKTIQHSEDYTSSVRIDGLIRNNIGAEIGDIITVKKIKTYPAYEITMKPLLDQEEKLREIKRLDNTYLVECLEGIPLVHGDNIMVPCDEGHLTFNVIETTPENLPLEIHRKTIIHLVDYVDLN